MADNEEKLKKSFDQREKHADNIIWRAIKEKAKTLEYGTFEIKVIVHAKQIREIEIYNSREKTRVV